MQGKGERLTFIPPGAEGAFLLVIPPIHCDTAAVYRRYDEIHPGEGLPTTARGERP